MQQLTPNLVFPAGTGGAYSSIALGPTPWSRYGYLGIQNAGIAGQVVKFGPLLRSVPPCDSTGVTLTGMTSRSTVTVLARRRALSSWGAGAAKGPVVRYVVTLANANRKNKTTVAATFAQAGLEVTLPAGTAYVKGAASPLPKAPGAKYNKTLAAPVYDAATNTVLFRDIPLAGGKKRKYVVTVKVLNTAVSPLVFQAACPFCPQLTTQSSVTVRVLRVYVWISVLGRGR